MYQYVIGLGLILGVIVDNSKKDRKDTGAFRIPMAAQLIFPIILICGLLLFAPESPRVCNPPFNLTPPQCLLLLKSLGRPMLTSYSGL